MKETTLTPLAEKLLETVRAAGGEPLSRKEIARRMGRPNMLPPHDMALLDKLAADGLIEKQARKKPRGVVAFEFTYRAMQQPEPTP